MMLVTAISDGGPQGGLIANCEWPHGEALLARSCQLRD
jgi:hypothetical protein